MITSLETERTNDPITSCVRAWVVCLLRKRSQISRSGLLEAQRHTCALLWRGFCVAGQDMRQAKLQAIGIKMPEADFT